MVTALFQLLQNAVRPLEPLLQALPVGAGGWRGSDLNPTCALSCLVLPCQSREAPAAQHKRLAHLFPFLQGWIPASRTLEVKYHRSSTHGASTYTEDRCWPQRKGSSINLLSSFLEVSHIGSFPGTKLYYKQKAWKSLCRIYFFPMGGRRVTWSANPDSFLRYFLLRFKPLKWRPLQHYSVLKH